MECRMQWEIALRQLGDYKIIEGNVRAVKFFPTPGKHANIPCGIGRITHRIHLLAVDVKRECVVTAIRTNTIGWSVRGDHA